MKSANAPKSIAPFVFEGVKIRTTPKGEMAVVDVLQSLGYKNPRKAWSDIREHYPDDFVTPKVTYRFGKGRPPEVLDKQSVYRLAMVAGGPKALQFREAAANLIEGYETADPTLTADLIDRTDNPVDLEHLGERIKSKATVLSLQGEARERGMVRRFDYAKMNDENNVFITGNTASEIKSLRETEITRDSFSTGELALLSLTQHAQVQNLKIKDARGAGQILNSNQEVRDDLRHFRDKYFGPKRRPADRDGQAPVITVPV